MYRKMAFLKMIGLVAILLALMSSVTWASTFVPFINNMLLGRTFDYSKSQVGNDIISNKVRKEAVTRIPNVRTKIKYKVIKSSEDVRDVLDVSGQLSLKVMAGTVDVEGKGSYLKSSVKSGNSIEVLAQVHFTTVTKSLHDDLELLDEWNSGRITGKHYIRSLVYGGYLIASFKFVTDNENKAEKIQASVDANVETASTNVGVKGQFEKIASSVSDHSSLTITYTSSVISNSVPVDIKTLVQVIQNFKDDIKQVNDGDGVPLLAEIRELYLLRDNSASQKFRFLKNSVIIQKMERMATMFHDLKVTSDALEDTCRGTYMTIKQEKKYGEFNFKLTMILDVFYKAIQNLDLNANEDNNRQFDSAISAYQEKESYFLPGKFFREFQKFKKANFLGDPALGKIGNKLNVVQRRVRSLGLRLSGNELSVTFSKTKKNKNYMITRGAPAMDNLMVCFSSRSLAKKRKGVYEAQTFFAYVTTSYEKQNSGDESEYSDSSNENNSENGNEMVEKFKPVSKTQFKIFSDKNGKILISRGETVEEFDKVKPNDMEWHSWCFYLDKSGTATVYKNGQKVQIGREGALSNAKIPAGGVWIVGQESEKNDAGYKNSATFKGEIANVNVYGNFVEQYFRTIVAPEITSTTCRPTIYSNLLKSWEDFKVGFVGKLNVLSKNFCN